MPTFLVKNKLVSLYTYQFFAQKLKVNQKFHHLSVQHEWSDSSAGEI